MPPPQAALSSYMTHDLNGVLESVPETEIKVLPQVGKPLRCAKWVHLCHRVHKKKNPNLTIIIFAIVFDQSASHTFFREASARNDKKYWEMV